MRHHLVRFFAGGIQAERVVGAVMDAEWHVGIGTVDGARRCVDEMLDVVMPASFENIQKAYDIGLDVAARVLN